MIETFGWILSGIGMLGALRVMAISGRLRPPRDGRSVFQSELDHHRRLEATPGFRLLLFGSLGLLLLGMYLVGMIR